MADTNLDTVLKCRICGKTFPLDQRVLAEEHAMSPIEDGLPQWFALRNMYKPTFFFYAKEEDVDFDPDHQRMFGVIEFRPYEQANNFVQLARLASADFVKRNVREGTMRELTEEEFSEIIPKFNTIALQEVDRYGSHVVHERQIDASSIRNAYYRDLQEIEEAQRALSNQ